MKENIIEYSYTIPFVLHKNCLIENDSDLVSGLSSANSVKDEYESDFLAIM